MTSAGLTLRARLYGETLGYTCDSCANREPNDCGGHSCGFVRRQQIAAGQRIIDDRVAPGAQACDHYEPRLHIVVTEEPLWQRVAAAHA